MKYSILWGFTDTASPETSADPSSHRTHLPTWDFPARGPLRAFTGRSKRLHPRGPDFGAIARSAGMRGSPESPPARTLAVSRRRNRTFALAYERSGRSMSVPDLREAGHRPSHAAVALGFPLPLLDIPFGRCIRSQRTSTKFAVAPCTATPPDRARPCFRSSRDRDLSGRHRALVAGFHRSVFRTCDACAAMTAPSRGAGSIGFRRHRGQRGHRVEVARGAGSGCRDPEPRTAHPPGVVHVDLAAAERELFSPGARSTGRGCRWAEAKPRKTPPCDRAASV